MNEIPPKTEEAEVAPTTSDLDHKTKTSNREEFIAAADGVQATTDLHVQQMQDFDAQTTATTPQWILSEEALGSERVRREVYRRCWLMTETYLMDIPREPPVGTAMWDLRELQLIFGNEMNLALAERAFTEVLNIVLQEEIEEMDEKMAWDYARHVERKARGLIMPCGGDPLLDWLLVNGYIVKNDPRKDFIEIKCPWGHEHTAGTDTAGYSPQDRGGFDRRTFNCFHEHCAARTFRDFREWAVSEGAPFVPAVDHMTPIEAQYAYVSEGKRVADMVQRERGGNWIQPLEEWSNDHYRKVEIEGRKDPVLMKTAFLESDSKMSVARTAFDPRIDDGIYLDCGQRIVNEYIPPKHDRGLYELNGTPHEFLTHVSFLVPNKEERELYLDWLAWKVQNPGKRSYAIIMVAENAYGIGRSLHGDQLAMIWGAFAGRVSLPQLSGRGSQAEQNYNDWAKKKLFLLCEEAHEGEKVDYYSGYETLKQYIDTRPTSMRMNTKFGAMSDDLLWFNVLLFTNHADAIPLPEDDRRFCVIENPSERRNDDYYCRLASTITPEYIARVWHWLRDRDVSGFNPKMPPMTAGKRRMISSTRGPIDTLWNWVVENAPGALVTKHVLAKQIRKAAREVGEQERLSNRKDATINALWKKCEPLRPEDKNGARYRFDGKQHEVRALRSVSEWRSLDEARASDPILEEVTKNGVHGEIIGSGG